MQHAVSARCQERASLRPTLGIYKGLLLESPKIDDTFNLKRTSENVTSYETQHNTSGAFSRISLTL
jgi:hypothetical protein